MNLQEELRRSREAYAALHGEDSPPPRAAERPQAPPLPRKAEAPPPAPEPAVPRTEAYSLRLPPPGQRRTPEEMPGAPPRFNAADAAVELPEPGAFTAGVVRFPAGETASAPAVAEDLLDTIAGRLSAEARLAPQPMD